MKRREKNSKRTWRLWCLAVVFWSAAAPADTFLILSLVGDRLTIVTPRSQVGSHLEPGGTDVIPLKDTELDDSAVGSAADTIKKARPAASVTMLRAKDPRLYKIRDGWVDADSVDIQKLTTLVTTLFSPPVDSHLLLITPYRDNLQLKTDRSYLGGGSKAAGLGFYVDNYTRMFDTNSLNSGPVFLGTFANFRLVLINLDNNAIVAQRRATVGTTYPAVVAPDKTAWNALSGDKKVASLQWLMKGEMNRLLPDMLTSAKP